MAPQMSQRMKLINKGYREYNPGGGRVSFGHAKAEAEYVVKQLHKRGYLARIITIHGMEGDYHYQIMYKKRRK